MQVGRQEAIMVSADSCPDFPLPSILCQWSGVEEKVRPSKSFFESSGCCDQLMLPQWSVAFPELTLNSNRLSVSVFVSEEKGTLISNQKREYRVIVRKFRQCREA